MYPMKLVGTILLTLSYEVKTAFNVPGLAGEFAVFGDLNGCFVIDHKNGWGCREALNRLLPLFGSKEHHVI